MKNNRFRKGRRKGFSDGEIQFAKIILGLGLAGLALHLSPVSLSELITVFAVPALVLMAIIYGAGMSTSNVYKLANNPEAAGRIQQYLRQRARRKDDEDDEDDDDEDEEDDEDDEEDDDDEEEPPRRGRQDRAERSSARSVPQSRRPTPRKKPAKEEWVEVEINT